MRIQNSQPVEAPFAAAVVIPTIVRPSLKRAVHSVFNQDTKGKIQVLIGVDKCLGDPAILDELLEEAPDHVCVTVVDPGYSTSVRHNGVHSATDGGAIRTALSFLANSRYVAYLDDDNYWANDHISSLLKAIDGVEWSCSLRWLVDEDTEELLTVDKWHSVGVGKTTLTYQQDGFADPNTIMVDKLACASLLHNWSTEYFSSPGNSGADRLFSNSLMKYRRHRPTAKATCYYMLRRGNILWSYIKKERRSQAQSANAPAKDLQNS